MMRKSWESQTTTRPDRRSRHRTFFFWKRRRHISPKERDISGWI